MNEIISFLKSEKRNAWLDVDDFSIYVRKGFHGINGKIVVCFDIANIVNNGERGKGKFKEFVCKLKTLLENNATLRGKIEAIYVECVLNPRLKNSLPKMGFNLEKNTMASFSMTLNLQGG